MKRQAIALITLALSTSGLAVAENIETYGSVLNDPVAKSSSYNNPDTYLENHGSVLLDGVSANRGLPRSIERGLDRELSVGEASSLFWSNADDPF